MHVEVLSSRQHNNNNNLSDIRFSGNQFVRHPLPATVPPKWKQDLHEIELSLANALIHPRASRAASYPGSVCARSPTNRHRVTAQGDGLSFDAADEQLLSALEREEQ